MEKEVFRLHKKINNINLGIGLSDSVSTAFRDEDNILDQIYENRKIYKILILLEYK